MKKSFFTKFLPSIPYILLGMGLALWLYRWIHFLSSDIPLWYDAGFYKLIFSVYHTVISTWSTSSIPYWFEHEPLIGVLWFFFHLLGISYDQMIMQGTLLLSLLPGVILFVLFRKEHSYLAALLAILYWTSLVQYELFYWVYIKQILGIALMLLMLYYSNGKRYLLSALFLFLIILLHRTTALYAALTLVMFIGFTTLQQKKFPVKLVLMGLWAIALWLCIYIPFWSIISWGIPMLFSGYGGYFLDKQTYILYSAFPLFLSLVWLFAAIKKKKVDIFFWWYVVWVLWILVWLVNFNRVLGFLDIFVLIFAFRGVVFLFQTRKRLGRGIVVPLLVYSIRQYISFVPRNMETLIIPEEFTVIKSFAQTLDPSAIIMITSKNYTPWIAGYAEREYISPGYSALNTRDENTWNQWWEVDGQGKCSLLKDYQSLNRPLYLWIGQDQYGENLSWGNCLSLVKHYSTSVLYRVIFK